MVLPDGERSADRGRGLRRARGRSGAGRQILGERDHRRSAQPSPLPAAALPGGDRGAESSRHRLAGAGAVFPGAQRRRASRARGEGGSGRETRHARRRPRLRLGLPHPRLRGHAQLLRTSRVGGVRAWAQDARTCHRDPAAHPLCLRVGGKRSASRGAAAPSHLRDRGRRAHRRGAGGGHRGHQPDGAGARLPSHRSDHRACPLAGGGPAHPACVRRGAFGARRGRSARAGRRGADLVPRDRDRRERGRDRRPAKDCRQERLLGGRRPGLRAWPIARGRARSRRAGEGERGPVDPRPPRRVRDRRHGPLRRTRARPGARAGARGHPGGAAGGAQRSRLRGGPAAPAVPLSRQGDDGHHRKAQGHRADGPPPPRRISRLGGVAVHPHPLPDRLQEPLLRLHAVGVELPLLQARSAADHPSRAASGCAAVNPGQ